MSSQAGKGVPVDEIRTCPVRAGITVSEAGVAKTEDWRSQWSSRQGAKALQGIEDYEACTHSRLTRVQRGMPCLVWLLVVVFLPEA
jgi:hypothetical protein